MKPELTVCIDEFRRWLHLPDPGHVLAVLAACAVNRAAGDPVWLLVIGGASAGKTEAVMSLSGQPDVRVRAVITEGGLLSATPKRERTNGASGGLLREIGDFGIVVLKDFTTVLAMNRDTRAMVLAALREVYDGSWSRSVGTDGGRTLQWSGKLGLIAGCTAAYDTHYSVISSLGDRFIVYRLPPAEDDALGGRSIDHTSDEPAMRAALVEAANVVLAAVDGDQLVARPSDAEKARLVALSSLAARSRSAVDRDPHTREIDLIHPHEAPGRLAAGLLRLFNGLLAIGAGSELAWAVVAKSALDCIPPIRRAVLQQLATTGPEPDTAAGLAVRLGYPTTTTRRALEDLAAHGVLRRASGGATDHWYLSIWGRRHWMEAVPELSVVTGEGTKEETSEQFSLTDNSGTGSVTHPGVEAVANGACPHPSTATAQGVTRCLHCPATWTADMEVTT